MIVLPAGQHAKLIRPRRLYVVPKRRVARAGYVPPGRSLHLVDLENLMGGPGQGEVAVKVASRAFRELAGVRARDHVLVGVNPRLGADAKLSWPDGLVLLGTGPDGADRALLCQIEDRMWVAKRYDRIVIGSGDGIFAPAASGFRDFGLAVVVVSREYSLSHRLAQAADAISILPEVHPLKVVA